MPEVRGKIVDYDTDKPLAFVHISLDGKETATNIRGEFSVIVPPGTYIFRIRSPHYEPITETIEVTEDIDLGEIKLRRMTVG